jgi:hypothetical protein
MIIDQEYSMKTEPTMNNIPKHTHHHQFIIITMNRVRPFKLTSSFFSGRPFNPPLGN